MPVEFRAYDKRIRSPEARTPWLSVAVLHIVIGSVVRAGTSRQDHDRE